MLSREAPSCLHGFLTKKGRKCRSVGSLNRPSSSVSLRSPHFSWLYGRSLEDPYCLSDSSKIGQGRFACCVLHSWHCVHLLGLFPTILFPLGIKSIPYVFWHQASRRDRSSSPDDHRRKSVRQSDWKILDDNSHLSIPTGIGFRPFHHLSTIQKRGTDSSISAARRSGRGVNFSSPDLSHFRSTCNQRTLR